MYLAETHWINFVLKKQYFSCNKSWKATWRKHLSHFECLCLASICSDTWNPFVSLPRNEMRIKTIEVKNNCLLLYQTTFKFKNILQRKLFVHLLWPMQNKLKILTSILFSASGCSGHQTHSPCVGIISRHSQVHQNVPFNRSFSSSFSLSRILRIRNMFCLKTVRLKIRPWVQTCLPGQNLLNSIA